MNRIYRVIFCATTGRYTVVAEHAKSRGKRGSTRALVPTLAVTWLLAGQVVWAAPAALELPVNGQVTAGQASVQAGSGAVLNINQTTERASIQWESFNIGAGASVIFRQPSAQSVTLNRVQGTAPSEIFGNLQANGQVFVLNPNGILFGPTAQVNVGGIVATTHSLSDADFMAGRAFFDRAGARGAVINQGNIHTALAGYAALLAPEVRNEGIIVAQMGTVALASGEAIRLQFEGSSAVGLTVTPSTIASLVANQRAIQAPGGLIILAAQSAPALASGVIQNSGTLQATGAALKDGRIVLQASDQVLVTGGSLLDVGNAVGTGGKVTVTADHIALADSSVVNATGRDGGGTIHIGGAWQGSGDTPQASAVYVGQDVHLDASATRQGPGGEIVVWSDIHKPESATRVYGSLSAQGGAQGGDGGRIETSGHWLDVSGIRANASATHGRSGLWLLDPFDLEVTTSATTASTAGGPPFTFSSGSGATNVLNTDISAQLNTGTSVVLQTTGTAGDGQGLGDITIQAGADIAKTSGGDAALSFKAHGNIRMTNSTSITSTAGKLNLVFNSDLDGDGQGFVYLFDATVRTNGGNIVVGGGIAGDGSGYAMGNGDSTNPNAVNLDSSTVDAGGGNITLRGNGFPGNFSFSEGVGLFNSIGPMLLTTSGTGSITIDGVGGGTGSGLQRTGGVIIRGSSVTNTGTGDITIIGVSGPAATTNRASGVTLSAFGGVSSTVSTSGGNISITGTGSPGIGDGDNYGVFINGANNLVSAGGSGMVTITGTGGAGIGTSNAGVGISDGGVASASGAISVTGLPGGTTASGILLAGTASIASTGNAPVTLTTDSLDLAATSAVSAGTGTVTVQNRTAGTLINLGGADVLTGSPLTLGLTDAELDRITAGTLVIGRTGATAAGDMTISAAISPALARNLTLLAGGDVVENASTGITTLANGNLLVNSDADGNGSGAIVLGSSVTTNGGNITLGGGVAGDGLGNARGTSTQVSGVRLTGAVNAGGGNITVHGQGFNGAFDSQYGIVLSGASLGTSGSGTMNLVGLGGAASAGDFNAGIEIANSSTLTGAGATTLTGTGGAAAGASNQGVHIATNSSVIGGAGLLTINGVGGAATGGGNGGVTVDAATVTAGAGGASITGVGGAGTGSSNGVTVKGTTGQILSTGGNLSIVGTGSATVAGNSNIGVELSTGTQILGAGNGTVSVTGTGGTGTGGFNLGVYVSSASISSSGTGAVSVVGTGTGSNAGQDFGVQVTGNTARIASGGGNVSVQGTGGSGAGNSQYGVNVNTGGTVTAGGSGSVTVQGQGGAAPGNFNIGVNLFGSGSRITSNGGAVSVTGTGAGTGTSSSGYGVLVQNGTQISSGGTGALTVQGTGNNLATNFNRGITVTGGSIASAGGDVTLTGQGGGSGTSQNGHGVRVDSAGVVSAGGAGNLLITGVGSSATTASNTGVSLADTNSRISTNNGTIQLVGSTLGTSQPGVDLAVNGVVQSGANNTVTVTTDSYRGDGTASISAGTGIVNIRNRTAGTLINLGGADVLGGSPLTLGLADAELDRITAGTLVVGRNDATAAGAITVSAAISPALASNLTVLGGGDIAIGADVTVANTLVLTAGTSATASGSGNLSATNLLLNGSGASYILDTAVSNAVSTLAAGGTGAVRYRNNSALTIGAVGAASGINASGPVVVSTASGNLTVAQTVQTSDSSSAAVVLNAGQAAAAGTASGGDILLSGSPGINVGAGGRATLLTGSVAGSTGVTALVGSGSGNFRYNSDETTTNYTAPLGAGHYAVYREAPTITVTANADSKTYDGNAYSGGNGYTPSGFANGDTGSALAGAIAYGGSAQGARNAGNYAITPSGLSSTLGYGLAYVAGSLTVNPAAITLSTSNLSKGYDGTTNATGSPSVAAGTLFGGDTLSGGTFTFDNKNVGLGNKVVSVSGIVVNDGNGGANYLVSYANNTGSSITPANLTVTAPSVTKAYDGTTSASGTATVGALAGAGAGETVGTGPTLAFDDKNAGTGKTVQASGLVVLDSGGVDVTGNYAINYVGSSPSTITAASLSVTAPSVTKTYDGTTIAIGTATVGGLSGTGDVVGNAPVLAYSDPNAGTGKTVQANGLLVRDSGGVDVTANYAINYVDNTSSVIQQAPLTVSANADARFVTQADTVGYYGASYSGFVAGETASVLGGSLAISRPNAATDVAAGTYVGALVPAGLTSGNYTISFAPGNYTIVPANQLLVRVANSSVVYGSDLAFSLTSAQYLDTNGSTIHDLVGSSSANSFNLNDGVGGGVNFTLRPSGATLSSAGHTVVGNYAVNDPGALISGNNFNSLVFVGNLAVTPKPVTASAASGLTKVYDGTTSMTGVSLALVGQEAGDLLAVSGAGAFSQKNVGSGLGYTVNNLSLGGADAGNYYLVGGSSFTGSNGAITPRPVTVTGVTATDKVYDGSTLAGLGGAPTVAAVAGDDLAVGGGVGSFADKNVGNGKTVTVNGYSLSGADAANYTVVQPTGLAANITPRTLNLVVSGNDKVFDGTTQATVSTSDDRVPGDVLNFQVDARFADPNVGTGKPVTVNGLSVSGLDAGNYTVAATGNVVADITAIPTPPLPPVTPPIGGPVAPLPASTVVLPSGNAIDGLTKDGRSIDPELRVLPQPGMAAPSGWTEIRTIANTPGFVRVQTFEPLVGTAAQIFGFTLPPDTFVHSDPAATIVLDARTASGGPLPPWLTFNPGNRRFSGTPPADARELAVVVTARDPVGNEASTRLVLTFTE
nr:YDG domain-containing protein [uncultured Albidiferax sp.]